jgi:transposase
VPQRAQLARPKVRGGAGFHADQTGWQRGEVGDDLGAPEAALHDGVARLVYAMHLEDVLGQVEADRCNLDLDGSPLVLFDSHQLGTTMPRGGHPPHQIQALDRTQPGLPLKKGRAGTMTHDYIRHGTTTLFAALNVLDGSVIGQCMARHRHQEFIRFLNAVERGVPAGKLIHAILDNYAAHKHPKVRTWLTRHPRWTFHFTSTSCSWVNAVETFFAALTRRRLQRGAFRSLIDLQAAINCYLAEHNQQPKPFVWTADPNRIIDKVNRGYQTLASDH